MNREINVNRDLRRNEFQRGLAYSYGTLVLLYLCSCFCQCAGLNRVKILLFPKSALRMRRFIAMLDLYFTWVKCTVGDAITYEIV